MRGYGAHGNIFPDRAVRAREPRHAGKGGMIDGQPGTTGEVSVLIVGDGIRGGKRPAEAYDTMLLTGA